MKTLTRSAFLKNSAAAAGVLAMPNGLFAERRAPAVLRGARKTVNFWSFTNTRTAWQQKAWALYQKRKKPDFNINWVILPYNQMHDKVMIAGQAGSGGPDIADIEISQFGRFIKGEVIFADLTPRLEKIGALSNLYRPSATDPWSWKRRVYGLGNELNTCLLSYRWDIWKKAGVRTPITTWAEFVDQARRYHRDTGKYLIDFPFDGWGSWWMLTLQQGGGFFGPDGQIAFNSPKGLKTLTFMQNAIKDGWAMLRQLGQSYNAALASGTVSCLLGPSWNFSGFVQQSLAQTKGQWHLQPFPAWIKGGSRTATWGGTAVTVLKASPMAAEAADLPAPEPAHRLLRQPESRPDLALFVPSAVGAFGIFLMRQYTIGVPTELLDAGRIDGSSEFGLWWRVVVPLVRPGLAVLAILSFTNYWNDFFWPLIVTTQPWMFVINLGLASLIGPYDYQYGIQLSGALLASLPVIIVFLIFQRQFVEGLTQGAFKRA